MRYERFCGEYWFNFDRYIDIKKPLDHKTLKICKFAIDNYLSDKHFKSSSVVHFGTKERPMKYSICKKLYDKKSNHKVSKNNIDSNLYEADVSISFRESMYTFFKNTFNFYVQIVHNVLNYFKIKRNTKLNIEHYYLINNAIYVTHLDSLIRFTSAEDYLREIAKPKKVDIKYLYKPVYNHSLNISSIIDTIILKIVLYIHLIYLKSFYKNRFNFRLNQTNWGFYISNTNVYNLFNNFMSGIIYIWIGIRFWITCILLSIAITYFLLYIRLLPFNKIILSWILLAMFLYWLISGFVFFIKKYQYGKFTSSIQRFWKRTYVIFWLIEAGTFLTFFYLTINATSEPTYMYDQLKIYKTHLFSWRWFLLKLIPSVTIILLAYYLQLMLKWNIFNKQSPIILLITVLLLYILWLEFYQFYHILNFYNNINWLFDYDEYIWSLELDTRRTRLTNNYIAICLFAKFWHFVFIFIFWVFFILRANELDRVRYPLLAANIQNFIIIYIMSWVYMYPWFKFVFRKYLDINYYWFFTNNRELCIRLFFNDIKLFFLSFIDIIYTFSINNIGFSRYSFYYWISSTPFIDYNQYRKFIVRDTIIQSFNNYII